MKKLTHKLQKSIIILAGYIFIYCFGGFINPVRKFEPRNLVYIWFHF